MIKQVTLEIPGKVCIHKDVLMNDARLDKIYGMGRCRLVVVVACNSGLNSFVSDLDNQVGHHRN
jgi:hypothetical protein